jgi:hypothetical protein
MPSRCSIGAYGGTLSAGYDRAIFTTMSVGTTSSATSHAHTTANTANRPRRRITLRAVASRASR